MNYPLSKKGENAQTIPVPVINYVEFLSLIGKAVSVFKPSEVSASSPEPSAARTFFFFGHIFIVAAVVTEVELVCSVVLISGAQQSDVVKHVYSS